MNEFAQKLGMGDLTTFVYQFIYNENDNGDTNIIKCFIMHGLVLSIKIYSYVVNMLYAWSFSNNTAFRIAIDKNKYFPSLNKNITVFSCGSVNSNKNGT